MAGIPVTHRGLASGFVVLAGHIGEALDQALAAVRPQGLTLVIMMGLARRGDIAARLAAHGWPDDTPAAIVCGASTPAAWTWSGTLAGLAVAAPPAGVAGVLVIGRVVEVRAAVDAACRMAVAGDDVGRADVNPADEVKYGHSR